MDTGRLVAGDDSLGMHANFVPLTRLLDAGRISGVELAQGSTPCSVHAFLEVFGRATGDGFLAVR